MAIGSGRVKNPDTGEWEFPNYRKMNDQIQRQDRQIQEFRRKVRKLSADLSDLADRSQTLDGVIAFGMASNMVKEALDL